MSTFPRIAPRGTPLSATGVRTSLPAVYDVYPKRLPSAPDIQSRINVLAPNPPRKRRHVSLETMDKHFQNEQRSRRMQQREHYRYHSNWSKYYYGSLPEQESYRSYMRTVLKQQMTDKWSGEKQMFINKVQETVKAQEEDKQACFEEQKKWKKKFEYLTTYRDANKQLMEDRERQALSSRALENKYDREQLRYNPINWSGSLK